jgi:hypothetical protein
MRGFGKNYTEGTESGNTEATDGREGTLILTQRHKGTERAKRRIELELSEKSFFSARAGNL